MTTDIKDNLALLTAKLEGRVKNVIAEQLDFAVYEVKNDDSFIDGLGADSLDLVELLIGIEDEFQIEFQDHEAEAIGTVQQLIDAVAVKVQALNA